MPTQTLVLGFCVLGYLAQFKHPGLVYPIVGIHVAVLKLIFKLVQLLGLVFQLLEFIYHAVLKIELMFKLIYKLARFQGLWFEFPRFEAITVLVVELCACCAQTCIGLLGPIVKLSKLLCLIVLGFEPLVLVYLILAFLLHIIVLL